MTGGRKPRGFKKSTVSFSDYHLKMIEKIRVREHQPDCSAAVRWLIDKYVEEKLK